MITVGKDEGRERGARVGRKEVREGRYFLEIGDLLLNLVDILEPTNPTQPASDISQ